MPGARGAPGMHNNNEGRRPSGAHRGTFLPMTHKSAQTFVLALIAGAVLGNAGCRPLPSAPPPPPPQVLLLPAPRDSVVAAAADALTDLEWNVGYNSPAEGVLRAERVRAQGGNARFLACPPDVTWWGPGMPRSTMRVDLTATPGTEGTRVEIVASVVSAWAVNKFDRVTEPVKCVSSGAIESDLADALRVRFRRARP